jgi:hypothetical protein
MTERQDASGHQALRNGAAWDALRTIRVAIEGYLPPGGILPADDILSSLTAGQPSWCGVSTRSAGRPTMPVIACGK